MMFILNKKVMIIIGLLPLVFGMLLISNSICVADTYTIDRHLLPKDGTHVSPSETRTYNSDEEAKYIAFSSGEPLTGVLIDGKVVEGTRNDDGTITYVFPKGTTGTHTIYGTRENDYYIQETGFTWQQRKDSIAVGVGYKTTDKAPEFRFQTYNLQTKSWEVISDWSSSNWVDWKGTVGDYWLHCEMRSADKLATTSKTMAFRYTAGNAKINGTYSGWRNGEVLLGATTVNQNTKIQFKIYNLDTQQWSYLTDENNRSNWVSWQAKKGNYWVHFESRTDDGRLADTNTYCFAVK